MKSVTPINLADLFDVDMTGAQKNYAVKYDGSGFQIVDPDYNFEFSIASFADDQTNTQEVGSGTWKTTGNINFTMTYNNGPPTEGTIALSSNGGVSWSSPITLSGDYLSAASAENTSYPSDKDKYITFTLDVTNGENDTDTETVYFRNQIRWGKSSTSTGWSSAEIVALSGSTLSNDHTRGSMSVSSVGASDYIIFAHPSSYSTLDSTDFSYDSLIIAMESPETISVTNDSGFTENYKVYRSTLTNLGDHTLESNESSVQNYLYWGELNKSSSYTESDVESNYASQPGRVISNTISSRSMIVNCAAGEYAYIAYPARLSALSSILISGFESLSDFTVDTTSLSITNANGYAENYRVYVSNNHSFSDPTEMIVSI